jgi:Glycosyl hydrolases family 15
MFRRKAVARPPTPIAIAPDDDQVCSRDRPSGRARRPQIVQGGLIDALALDGRHDEAAELFERLLGVRNDLGLLAEEYDPAERRLLGNFPQAFSHIALLNSALNLAKASGRSEPRRSRSHGP